MNEPKRRGRPPKVRPAIIALPVVEQPPGSVPVMNGDAAREPEDIIAQQLADSDVLVSRPVMSVEQERAQAYAMRVWAGQSAELKTGERIARVVLALQGQGLPTDGIKYPGATDDDDWTEEDEKPIVWRKASQ